MTTPHPLSAPQLAQMLPGTCSLSGEHLNHMAETSTLVRLP